MGVLFKNPSQCCAPAAFDVLRFRRQHKISLGRSGDKLITEFNVARISTSGMLSCRPKSRSFAIGPTLSPTGRSSIVSNSTQPRNLNFHCKERARLGEVFADIAAQYSKSIFPTRSTEGGAFEGDRNPKSQIRIARELALNALQDHERAHQCGALVKAEVEEQLKKRT